MTSPRVDDPRESDPLVKNVDEPSSLEALHLQTRDLDLTQEKAHRQVSVGDVYGDHVRGRKQTRN